MSKLQDDNEYVRFKQCCIFPIVSNKYETRNEFGGRMKKVGNAVYPICLEDIVDLKAGKYGNHKYTIRDYREATVLVRHPFRPYELIPSDTSEYTIITDHLNDLVKIFKALGAKDCEETAKIIKRKTFKIKAHGRLKSPLFKVKGDFNETSDHFEESEYKMVIKREPGANNGYELACKIAEKEGLLEVREIEKVLKQFDSDIEGRDKMYQLSEILTESYHKTLDAVIEINKSGAFEFDGKLNIDNSCRRTIRIDKTIYFE